MIQGWSNAAGSEKARTLEHYKLEMRKIDGDRQLAVVHASSSQQTTQPISSDQRYCFFGGCARAGSSCRPVLGGSLQPRKKNSPAHNAAALNPCVRA